MAGCKKTNPTNTTEEPPEQPDPNTSSQEIGSGGGTINSTDDLVTMEIPAGALSTTETITITEIEPGELGSEFDEIADEIGIEKAYELGPDGLEFDQPVTVTFATEQTVTQESDSIEIAPAALLTSDGSKVTGLDSLRMEMDEETGNVTIAGELNHFSPLVKTEDVFQDVLVTFKVFGVPDELLVDDTFTALAHLVTFLVDHEWAFYEDASSSPVEPVDFETLKDQKMERGNSGEEDEFLSTGSFRYTCTEAGTGTFRAGGITKVVSKDFIIIVGIPVEVKKTVECVEAQETGVLYVSAENGDDEAGSGSHSTPFRSIGKAIEIAEPGNTIKVETGTYSVENTGESWDYPIGGLIIEAADPAGPLPILDGTGNEAFGGMHSFESLPKSVTVLNDEPTVLRNLIIRNFDQPGVTALSFEAGAITLEKISVENSGGVSAFGTAQVEAAGNTFTNTFVSISGTSTWNSTGSTLNQADISMGLDGELNLEDAEVAQGSLLAFDNATITITNSTFTESPNNGIRMEGSSSLTMTGGSVSNIAGTPDNFGIVTGGYGVMAWDNASLDIDGTEIADNFRTGIYFRSAGTLKVRNSTIENNGNTEEDTHGIELVVSAADDATVDLGTDADPGNNTWTGNATFQLYDGRNSGAVKVVDAAGNNWGEGVTPPTGIKTGPASEGDLWSITGSGNQIDFGGE